MGRRPAYAPLRVYLNNRRVGTLSREASGAVGFSYEADWLDWEHALPVSLSLPLRETPYRGEPVSAVFENLLPDSDKLRRIVAEKVGARGTDAYSMLTKIGHDCVGALQFIAGDDESPNATGKIEGEAVDAVAIEKILKGLGQAPLGLARDDAFRISVAGAQEKTALLWHDGRWIKPHGTTPTTHLIKTQIGKLPGGIDLSDSVENEYYCLKLTAAFGLPVNTATIETFGETKALVIERFDRRWTKDGRLLRLPQEDCCQALSVPPTLKYQNEGGPGMIDVLGLLRGSDTPIKDQDTFLKAQLVFWLMGATDAHAKNFSVFLSPGGSYRMTPLYDIVTAQGALDARQIERKQMRMAMSVGNSRHYRFDKVHGRHFVQTAMRAGLSKKRTMGIIEDIAARAPEALDAAANVLPKAFPQAIVDTVGKAIMERVGGLKRHCLLKGNDL
ncbi:type II toxin-antitoxin system HipA family toxin [Pseudosulfitobacter pseudonitzschiae]|uniref:type II toxin-antitoxin system HipA family toxin n=1 Tax=Pseudosulfitobacter pseudonitzschiae TaxID=1402135 RepID=UPI001AF973CB|nr:type II toxin-antitoxin system HipA family toxin [Pseudosulfitobacter pseudonitzschiae]MBM1817271.1 type II toxin-antitoxin system HipA family toxin [Pseudosulfitobacter pseudonitzschiae]MBM1834282.1 type II toxin-antitoxin system HipA family toxin [Pseudosulfitobacter pseudonitzschiae]MBM1839147.1 type II toxin-antitoxin system HipA family toxin [Pseudosulfitobacter pseudonitzschiae]MBM1843996.1 type II toxin-antitoxin system HipA family toxin [Pseudosulfitobacter pseudonitzschiae]MBM18488